jgi:predicted enzyme related to lactoylglutathione lyase
MPLSVTLGFTKLVVHDLDGMAAFYRDAYRLHAVKRVRGERIAGEEIDEIMLAADPDAPFGNFVLLKYVGRESARTREVLLGFVTDDLPTLLDRIVAAGGAVHDPMREMPELGVRVAFATDPEGHVAELVQLVT